MLSLCAWLPWPAAHSDSAPRPYHDDLPLPYHAQWGPYRVSVEKLSDEQQRLRIADNRSRVLREVRAPYVVFVDYPHLEGLNSPADLRVGTKANSNNVGDEHTYCFSRKGGLRNILSMPSGFDTARDLNGDGRPELLSFDPAPLEWLSNLCHACSPSIMVVLRWNGSRYVVANRRYPAVVREKALDYRRQFLAELGQPRPDYGNGQDLRKLAVGYWANLASIGEEKPVHRWILEKLPKSERAEFEKVLPEVRDRLVTMGRQIGTTNKIVIQAPE